EHMLQKLKGSMKKYGFQIKNAIGDAGYAARYLIRAIRNLGARAFIKVKSNHSAKKKGERDWPLLVEFQRQNPKEFQKVYCERVVIEGIFSAIKNIFGRVVRSKKRHSQNIELMGRILLWNYIQIEPDEF
ncbi:MAG: transposase, partial [Thermoplasmata archaeon]